MPSSEPPELAIWSDRVRFSVGHVEGIKCRAWVEWPGDAGRPPWKDNYREFMMGWSYDGLSNAFIGPIFDIDIPIPASGTTISGQKAYDSDYPNDIHWTVTWNIRPACPTPLPDAAAIELRAAQETLTRNSKLVNRFAPKLFGLSALGEFMPMILDHKYWFAKLYENITRSEIDEHKRFANPAFVLHFIPIFFNLYATNLDNFLRRDYSSVLPAWLRHFRTTGRPPAGSATDWLNAIAASLRTGAEAHIREGDMATALEEAYRSFVLKYGHKDVPFDCFRSDFFGPMRPVFDRSKAALLLHVSQMGPFPVSPEVGQFLLAKGEQIVGGGLPVDEIDHWRKDAWDEARRRLGQ